MRSFCITKALHIFSAERQCFAYKTFQNIFLLTKTLLFLPKGPVYFKILCHFDSTLILRSQINILNPISILVKFYFSAACVVPCGGCKMSPDMSFIV